MAYDPGAIDAALAAAVGDDPSLIAELRLAFVDSAERALAAVEQAGEDAHAWREAVARLRGLAASFGAIRLAGVCAEALEVDAGDQRTVKQLRRMVARL